MLLDIVWTKTVSAVGYRRPLIAANLSVALYALTAVSTVLIVEQCFAACIAYAVGSWIGSYVTVKWWSK
jgi:hypothetical protein